jgi:hypothetical protein
MVTYAKLRKPCKTIPMSPMVRKALEEQRERFIKKFGRPPGKDDPVWFDPDCDEPRPIDYEKYKKFLKGIL